jgi:phosphatidylinositol glycan class A protein
MASINNILLITPFFSPNIGGVETHLDDLVNLLNSKKIKSTVLTYAPLTTTSKYLSFEQKQYCSIIRFPYPGFQMFPKIEKYPLLTFLYLTPYLLIRSFLYCLHHKFSLIHSQGLNAAIIGIILSKIFKLPHLVSTHAVYENIKGVSVTLTKYVLSRCDAILCLSLKSKNQLISWGVDPHKITVFHYWIDLTIFKAIKIQKIYDYLFVGRLIPKKGVLLILKLAKLFPNNSFAIAGNGPLFNQIELYSKTHRNLHFLGPISNRQLPAIYNQSKYFLISSLYEEGFGRVVMEAVACGLPVIGSNLGALPEALTPQVSILFKPTLKNFSLTLNKINSHTYQKLTKACFNFSRQNFSLKNANIFLNLYRQLQHRD